MNKVKVGYLPLYIELYDQNNPHYRDPMVDYMHTLISMLESQGLEVVPAEVCRLKPEFDEAVARFLQEDVDAVITQHLAYSPSLESIEALLTLPVPIIVLDTTPDYSLVAEAGYSRRISNNHGIHGVQDLCSLLNRHHHPYEICVGHAMHSDVIARTAGLCRAAAARKRFKRMRVGAIGGEFTGMGDFAVSDARYRQEIGAEVFRMEKETAARCLAAVSEADIDAELQQDAAAYTVEVENLPAYRAVTKAGLAVRRFMDELSLEACTINFLHIDESGLPKMPFPECCKLLGRGKGYAGEGDVLTAGLVGALIGVYPETTFTEMFCPDWKENVILLSHMGESNPNLTSWKPILHDLPFHYNESGDTVGMYGCYRPGAVVLLNLIPLEDGFRLLLTQGKLLPLGLQFGAYRYATQGWLRPCKPLPQFLEEYSLQGGTHHSAMIYNADIRELKAFGRMMGFEVAEIL